MPDTKETPSYTENAICDALRYVCDASYAILPEDVAHRVGELKKNFWGSMKWLIDKRIEWIDARVEGGDRLREEWRRRAHSGPTEASGSGI
ncbi:MAG TPA: hypothetical protein VF723_15800 [Pyrinomonadaceae bacterium]|jgi:hypothetical protein